jgi:chromosome segregation ATPase
VTRALQIINLVGVLALAGLCAFQWRQNRTTNLGLIQTEDARRKLAETVEQQKKDLQARTADLEEFRERLGAMTTQWKAGEEKYGLAERRGIQLESERDQLKTSISNWVQAVRVRDEQLQATQGQIKELMADRNQIVAKFNELAERHARLVQDWNAQQARLAAANAQTNPPPARTSPK